MAATAFAVVPQDHGASTHDSTVASGGANRELVDISTPENINRLPEGVARHEWLEKHKEHGLEAHRDGHSSQSDTDDDVDGDGDDKGKSGKGSDDEDDSHGSGDGKKGNPGNKKGGDGKKNGPGNGKTGPANGGGGGKAPGSGGGGGGGGGGVGAKPAPATPGAPAKPATPAKPGAPAKPGVPAKPGAPATPGAPAKPGAPATAPGTPAKPGAPATPGAPAKGTTPAPPPAGSTQPPPDDMKSDITSPVWLVQPFGASIWEQGAEYVISWGPNPEPSYAQNLPAKTPITIYLNQDQKELTVLATDIDSSLNMWKWKIPTTLPPAKDYSIRLGAEGKLDTYSHYFEIVAAGDKRATPSNVGEPLEMPQKGDVTGSLDKIAPAPPPNPVPDVKPDPESADQPATETPPEPAKPVVKSDGSEVKSNILALALALFGAVYFL
ncbi:hypothetical protein DFQ26_000887 [Actinomortierella ambigua]|nr:hypothetical protein DFQ26_000887 [Actinomortierella ambigua]